MRTQRGGERGAETLEFVACVALLLVVVGCAGKAMALAHLQAQAENDVRALARQAAVCDSPHVTTLAEIDPDASARGGVATIAQLPGNRFVERVDIPPGATLAALGFHPHAQLSMTREPGC